MFYITLCLLDFILCVKCLIGYVLQSHGSTKVSHSFVCLCLSQKLLLMLHSFKDHDKNVTLFGVNISPKRAKVINFFTDRVPWELQFMLNF